MLGKGDEIEKIFAPFGICIVDSQKFWCDLKFERRAEANEPGEAFGPSPGGIH